MTAEYAICMAPSSLFTGRVCVFVLAYLVLLCCFLHGARSHGVQPFDMLTVYREKKDKELFWFNWVEDLMNVRPHLSPRLKQQLMVSFVRFLPLSLSLPFFLSPRPPPFCLSLLTSQGGHGQLAMGRGRAAVVPSLPFAASAGVGARTQPLRATTSQIWRDEAHVATDKPLWSISWMHNESVERKALKIKLCPWCAQQWLCGQWCQRQPVNIKELGAAGLSVLNTN